MALYPPHHFIKKRRNDLITPEDQQRRDLSNLPAGFWLPRAALTNKSKKLALSHLTCFSAAYMRILQETGSHWIRVCFCCLWLSIGILPHLDQLLHLLVNSFLLFSNWINLMSTSCLNTSTPCSSSVCSYSLSMGLCRKWYRAPFSPSVLQYSPIMIPLADPCSFYGGSFNHWALPKPGAKISKGSSSCFSQPTSSIPHQLEQHCTIVIIYHKVWVCNYSQLQIPQTISKWIPTLYKLDGCTEMNCKWKNCSSALQTGKINHQKVIK